ncbi:plasmid stabilization protein [Haloprofundus marisrubri]|uniref:Plasmid stabilization protein n=1 Tax=Haloprofundus marisrubri TaxID=1514971 RepID=A0A0W1REI5_9EURY|nr:hypothetical protein [Haloprofundus marisrubri]KTG11491.1 plasmid stabilization protein [Haloprofundus marisrubri]
MGDSYQVLLGEQPRTFLAAADEKTERIVRENLAKLGDDPYPRPGSRSGDKEKLPIDGKERYRLHIGRSYTAFYAIEGEAVKIVEILDIDTAHKRYGW